MTLVVVVLNRAPPATDIPMEWLAVAAMTIACIAAWLAAARN